LHQHGRAQVTIGVPPVDWTSSLAGGTEHALLQPVEFGPVVHGLLILLLSAVLEVLFPVFALELGADEAILVLEVSHVDYEVLDGVGPREREHLMRVQGRVHLADAGQRVLAVDVHGT